ncbi:MAG: hypothetical protein JWO19_1276, partial [Bryobacterales bacterium]|nr:hypothetical protein [Bryobacterales bacterium]
GVQIPQSHGNATEPEPGRIAEDALYGNGLNRCLAWKALLLCKGADRA